MFKNIIVVLFLLVIVFLPNNSLAVRSISSFPHYEDFEGTWTDIISSSNGSVVSKEQLSWRGGSNYCAKIIPPNTVAGGINGDYGGLGTFYFNQATINVAYAVYIGTSMHDLYTNSGGGLYWKYNNFHNSSNWASMLRLNNTGNHFEPSGIVYPSEHNMWKVVGSTTAASLDWPNRTTVFHLDDGIGTNDYAGQWVWMNWISTPTQCLLYIYTRDGVWSGLYYQYASTPGGNFIDFLFNFFNGYYPVRDANTYMLIDDLYIANNSTPIAPPTGFLSGEDTTPPTLSTKTIASNGATLTLAFNETVSIGAGGNGGWTISPSGGAANISYSSGSGTSSLVFTISRTIQSGETATISYTQPGNGVEDLAGNDLLSVPPSAVTNSSSQDTIPALIDNLSPSGIQACTSNPRTVTMSFTTNESASAKYGTADTTYALLPNVFGTTGLSHTQNVSVACGASYTYYIRTSDTAGNVNTSSEIISFSVASPQIAGPGGLRIIGGRLAN